MPDTDPLTVRTWRYVYEYDDDDNLVGWRVVYSLVPVEAVDNA